MSGPGNRLYEFVPFRIDAGRRLLMREGSPIPLTPKAFDTLLALVENNGRVLEKEELMKMLWPDSFVEERNLTVNISALRKALGESASDHRYVVTIPGQGYCFVADVKQLPSDVAGLVVEGHGTSRIVIREEVEREEERRTGQHKFLPSAVFASAWKTRRAILALLALIVLTAAVLYFR